MGSPPLPGSSLDPQFDRSQADQPEFLTKSVKNPPGPSSLSGFVKHPDSMQHVALP